MKNMMLLILIILCIVFIFYNSLKSAGQSIEESSSIVKIIERIVNVLYKGNPPEKVTFFFKAKFNDILRDSAHLLEFFILGFFTILYFDKFGFSIFKRFFFTLLLCILIAFIDERIQILSPGRTFQLYDIVLDILGGMAGSMLILLICKSKGRD